MRIELGGLHVRAPHKFLERSDIDPVFKQMRGKSEHLHWTGGFQLVGSSEPGGGWSWVMGEAFAYSNWPSGETNNSSDTEERIIFDHKMVILTLSFLYQSAVSPNTGVQRTAGTALAYERALGGAA